MRGVRQYRHVALRHGAFCVSGQHRHCRWWPAHFHVLFMKGWYVYSSWKQCLQSVNHDQFPIKMTQDNMHNNWLEILDFLPKLLWRTPTKIHRERRRRRQEEAALKAQRTAKATSSTQRPQTCTEAATKYWNCTANGADQEREHRLHFSLANANNSASFKRQMVLNHRFCSFTTTTSLWMKLPTIPPGLAGMIVKICPLSEPIRSQDFENSARSQAQKKINIHIWLDL